MLQITQAICFKNSYLYTDYEIVWLCKCPGEINLIDG